MRVLFATGNLNKVREVKEILQPLGFDVQSLADLGGHFAEPEETGVTFAENARIKAVAYAAATGATCLAEDSGLEVDALGGAPGVYSARYSGRGGTREERDRFNNEKLLFELRDVPEHRRAARFVCAMCLSSKDGSMLAETRGVFEGFVGTEPRGDNGFGYDPLLYLPDVGLTAAQLSSAEKHARSHRGQAARALAVRLKGP